MRRTISKSFIVVGVALFSITPLLAQSPVDVSATFSDAMANIRTIAVAAGGLLGGIVGLVGIGRTAYKLSQGDPDAMTSLIMAVVGVFLGFIAVMFLN